MVQGWEKRRKISYSSGNQWIYEFMQAAQSPPQRSKRWILDLDAAGMLKGKNRNDIGIEYEW